MCKALQVVSNLVICDFMVVRLVGFGIWSLTLYAVVGLELSLGLCRGSGGSWFKLS